MKNLLIPLTLVTVLSYVPPQVRAAVPEPAASQGALARGNAVSDRAGASGARPTATARGRDEASAEGAGETWALLAAGLGFMATVTTRRYRRSATT